ncbi:hypothetical protein [Candidatus Nitrosacidococcus tergens]|uniref:Uncharacterized protein n=1 Tax=Candidatus Nitrosacidococcus tergens TaxID=553981 RepID=A0A7G1Q761_9GAMM|nr:hypothetical protein [Candidatus Nitrosacidococcus tergens]CAB1274154.1 protein of unknown function [Candidatus Nitrosacidococcus tergens]
MITLINSARLQITIIICIISCSIFYFSGEYLALHPKIFGNQMFIPNITIGNFAFLLKTVGQILFVPAAVIIIRVYVAEKSRILTQENS